MLVAVRQHCQKAGALDGGVDLTLENRAGAGQACGDDFSVFRDKITQGVDVFVVDFFNASRCKTAKPLAFEQQGLVLRLGRLSLLKRFGPGMMDSLKGVQYLFRNWVKSLDVKNDTFAATRIDQKTCEPEALT